MTLRDLVRHPTPRPVDWPEPILASSAPFTLLRGVLEPASVALWVLSPTDRLERQKRALRYWYDNYRHAAIWQNETRWKPPKPTSKTAQQRMDHLQKISNYLGIPGTYISTDLSYCETVVASGLAVGRKAKVASARWREASAYAHGLSWASLFLSEQEAVAADDETVTVQFTLNEFVMRGVAELTAQVLTKAMSEWDRQAKLGPVRASISRLLDGALTNHVIPPHRQHPRLLVGAPQGPCQVPSPDMERIPFATGQQRGTVMVICSCGLIKQSKAGTTLTESGVEVCNNCLKPASMEAAVRVGPVGGEGSPVVRSAVWPKMMTTLTNVPGHHVVTPPRRG